ncbi:hypothetical protein BJ170DRAFT_684137 [Xylariales sp. AK1849]|nr:hypothetical protein BJ170DRAFT_684137 [Xylariales sp. AK1849]
MENKRKASGVNGVDPGADTPDRASKRRKLQEDFGDLANGETAQSTTAYGLHMLETIRATTDKNGRAVAPHFEKLPSKAADPGYYKRVRLPLSLELLERKLNNFEYPNLSSLESDFKRLVQNVKETASRTSEVFNDAERIRKAVSNLMVKQNPAYKSGNYSAVPTPLPPTPGPDEADAEEDAPGEEEDVDMDADPGADAEADADEDQVEEDAEGEEEEEDDDEEEADDEPEPEPEPIARKRRGGRPSRGAAAETPKASRSVSAQAADYVGFKGLAFQQAQDKIVLDLLQKKDEAEYYYFEPFFTLPPRSMKDYYEIIAEPLSLKALKKQVRGQHGRSEATGISDFKSWSQFEDQASLLWKNAYHYNEDGSDISVLAKELESEFMELLKEAKQHVQEPPQPKIKLKVPQSGQTPAYPPRKITIHVAGGKDSTAGSPAPATAQSTEGEGTRNGTPIGRNPFGGPAVVNLSQLDKARRSMSASGPSPSPSVPVIVKPEETARQSPAIPPPGPAMTTQQQFVPVMHTPGMSVNDVPPPPPPPPPKQTAADILEAQKYRPHPIKESEALISRVVISSHPNLSIEKPLDITIKASTTESQQELVFNAPATYFRLQVRPQIAPFLEAQQREWKLNVTHDFSRLYPSSGLDKRNDPVFDVTLRYGTNRFEIGLVAALPVGEKGPHGLNMAMEKFVIHFNLLRHH